MQVLEWHSCQGLISLSFFNSIVAQEEYKNSIEKN